MQMSNPSQNQMSNAEHLNKQFYYLVKYMLKPSEHCVFEAQSRGQFHLHKLNFVACPRIGSAAECMTTTFTTNCVNHQQQQQQQQRRRQQQQQQQQQINDDGLDDEEFEIVD